MRLTRNSKELQEIEKANCIRSTEKGACKKANKMTLPDYMWERFTTECVRMNFAWVLWGHSKLKNNEQAARKLLGTMIIVIIRLLCWGLAWPVRPSSSLALLALWAAKILMVSWENSICLRNIHFFYYINGSKGEKMLESFPTHSLRLT